MKQERLQELASEMRNAVQLFGGAALPAHFPPWVGTEAYRALTNKRVAAILRNSRRTAHYFAAALPEKLSVLFLEICELCSVIGNEHGD